MDLGEKSQSSQEDAEKEADDDILGCMEIDDAEDMNEVADILLHLNVSSLALHTRHAFHMPQAKLFSQSS